MGGPWEKYQKPVVSGPWSKYQSTQDVPPEVIQEMPDWLSSTDRFIAKNFAQSPEKQIEYLKSKYPDADVRLQDGEVQLRKPSEKSYKVLDPNTGFFSKDFLNDAGDLAYDTGAGMVQGAATTLGGLVGALAGGAGALPGAMAGSAASGAALEALRQKLGQELGINQDVSGKDALIAGGVGAVAPALFGAGKLTTGLGAKLAPKMGLTEEALQAAENAGRGGLERGWDYTKSEIAPKLGEMVSGIGKDKIKSYANNIDAVDQLEKNGVTDFTQNISDKVSEFAKNEQRSLGKNVVQAMEEAKVQPNLEAAKKVFTDKIAQIENQPIITNADKLELDKLKEVYRQYFGIADSETFIPDSIDALKAFDIQKKLKQAAKWETNMTPETAAVKGSARGSSLAINDALDEATGGLSKQAKDDYAAWKQIESELVNKFDDAQRTYSTITGLDAKGKKILAERLKSLADSGKLDLSKEIEILQAFDAFGNPSSVPIGFKGATSTSRSTPLAMGGFSLGSLLGYKTGGGYTAAALGGLIGAKAGNYFGSPEMIKTIIKSNKKLGEMAGKYAVPGGISQYLNPAVSQSVSPWFYGPSQP